MMKSQAAIRIRAVAAAVALIGNAYDATSFATFHHDNVVNRNNLLIHGFNIKHVTSTTEKKHHGLSMRKPHSTVIGPFALSMAREIEEKDYVSPMRQRPRPEGGDVAYTQENILRQLRHYNEIRKVGGKDCVQDIYVRDPNKVGEHYRYWFVGKLARCTGTVSPELALGRQLNLIEEHATRIRPVELGRYFGSLEVFAALGDTELLASQNDPGIRLKKMPRSVDGAEKVPLLEVGLNLEIVTNQGVGLFVVRTKDGVVPTDLIGNQN